MSSTSAGREATSAEKVVEGTRGSPDEWALRRVAEGDVGAIGELYERHAKALLRFASRVAGTADAEDIVQSTFVRAAKMAASYDGRSATGRAWLFGIAAHLMRERRRSLVRWARVVLRLRVERRALVAAPSVHASDVERRSGNSPRPSERSSCSRRSKVSRVTRSRGC
jgi:DNA-directed RNA polymerase specialized sigma24 family protein